MSAGRERALPWGWAVTVLTVVVVFASLWYGHAPPRSTEAYDKHADYSLSLLHSQLQTAIVWAEQHQEGQVTDAATLVALEESVKDATVTYDRFTGYVPPAGRDALLRRFAQIGSRALDELSDLRTAARRGDWARVHDLAQHDRRTSRRLMTLGEAAAR